MSLIPEKCIEYNDNRDTCVASENGKTYRLNNKSKFITKKVKIDKCLQQNKGEKRCDFLMAIEDRKLQRAIFIELKGGELTQALKQPHSTIVYLKKEFKNHEIHARIVGSKDIPRFLNNPSYLKLAREVFSTGGKIKRATNNIYSENI